VARTGGDVPTELEWLIDDWMARLPSEALRALRLIAASGTVTPQTLGDIGIFDRAELAALLDELVRTGMIREEHGALRAHRVWAVAALATLARDERSLFELGASLGPVMSER